MSGLPSGTVTFAFTDIAGSTRLLRELGDDGYRDALALHRRLVRDTFAGYDGREIDTQGDAFFYSFSRARQAVAAAVDVQRAHIEATWPQQAAVRVRIGLHTGEPVVGDEGYTGLDVVRAARIAAVGEGGQVLISDTTRAIAAGDLPDGVSLTSLGERRLKDIDQPEPIWELAIEGVATPVVEPAAAREEPAAADATRSPFEQVISQARERIESQVLTQLAASFGGDPDGAPPPPPGPPARPPRSSSGEIARLHRLLEDGALTEEQYRRAVDRILEADDR